MTWTTRTFDWKAGRNGHRSKRVGNFIYSIFWGTGIFAISFPLSEMPFGVLPVLEVDGEVISESIAICRYIAKTVGLYGETPLEQAQIDMVVDNINDFEFSQ